MNEGREQTVIQQLVKEILVKSKGGDYSYDEWALPKKRINQLCKLSIPNNISNAFGKVIKKSLKENIKVLVIDLFFKCQEQFIQTSNSSSTSSTNTEETNTSEATSAQSASEPLTSTLSSSPSANNKDKKIYTH